MRAQHYRVPMSEEYDPTDQSQDLIPQNELQAAQIREIALNGVEVLQQTARQMQSNSATMAQWILASLLAMNSGGAVAVLSASDKVVGQLGTPLIAFSIGAGFAVATGMNGLVTGMRVAPIMTEAIELLRLSIFESRINASTRAKLGEMTPILRQQLKVSCAFAAGSIVAFASGLASALF